MLRSRSRKPAVGRLYVLSALLLEPTARQHVPVLTSSVASGADERASTKMNTTAPVTTKSLSAQRSGTEAMELVRQALDVQDCETLGDAAQRAIDAYLQRAPESQDMAIVERACVAVALHLDREPPRLLKWAYVFEAADLAQTALDGARARAEVST